jgi:dihydrofolate synthase/folylpolyglutamate synthase
VAWALLEEVAAATEGRLAVSRGAAERGFGRVRWPGRLQWLALSGRPGAVLLDVAHDAESIRHLVRHVEASARPLTALVFTCLGDKDLPALAALLAGSPATRLPVEVPATDHPRSRPATEVVAALERVGLTARAHPDVPAALRAAVAAPAPTPPRVAAFGSFAVAGALLALSDDAGALSLGRVPA